MALLSQMQHRILSSSGVGKLLKHVEKKANFEKLDSLQQRNVELIRKEHDNATRLPEELVAALARQGTVTTNIWKQAKAAKDWSIFEPELVKLFELVKQRAEILMEVKDTATPYDAPIDEYEPKMAENTIALVFDDLRTKLVPFADRCIKASKDMDFAFLKRPVPIDIQRQIASELCNFIEYDVTSKQAGGRIDETEHPFASGYYDDVRITTHYYEDNFIAAFYSTLHEGGHAIYAQSYPLEWKYQPIGQESSAGIHESQSRFVENMVGRSSEFIKYFLPRLDNLTGGTFKDIPLLDFVRAVNRVQRSKIRVEADEVTYSLHVIIRFEIERALFAGKLDIPELPTVWNQKYDDYLGVKIKHDSEGVLQDTHWASSYFGYFPSYALGNIYGGQFLTVMERDLPDWRSQIAKGKFGKIKKWMVEHVYQKGNLYDPEVLVREITGKPLNAQPFMNYLEKKYTEIFNL